MNDFLPEIRRARFDKLTIYEVSHSELDVLERGSPDSIYLNTAISLLSIAISFTTTLLTTTVNGKTFTVFVVCTTVGYVAGCVLLMLWWRGRCSVLDCLKVIRKRLPPEGLQEPVAPTTPSEIVG